jgi:DNA mismatch repair protein MutS2
VVSVDLDQVKLEMDGKTVSASPGELSKVELRNAVKKPSKHVTLHVVENTEPELNLIGMTVEDAIARLDKFLDRAFVSQLREVTIIHGFGTGKLKRAVSEFLSTHTHVEKVQVEGGATIATLQQ